MAKDIHYVGGKFTKKYYNVLCEQTAFVHKFYREDAQCTFCDLRDADSTASVSSLSAIQAHWEELAVDKVTLDKIVCQQSESDGILITAVGTLSIAEQGRTERTQRTERTFVQTFFVRLRMSARR